MSLVYKTEAELIKRKIGSLEDVRARLGMSRRSLCKLLMVDPSAWSRWTRNSGDAPPMVYRALEWYLQVLEKYPSAAKDFQWDILKRELHLRKRREWWIWIFLAISLGLQLSFLLWEHSK